MTERSNKRKGGGGPDHKDVGRPHTVRTASQIQQERRNIDRWN
jgi:hypothetical protein